MGTREFLVSWITREKFSTKEILATTCYLSARVTLSLCLSLNIKSSPPTIVTLPCRLHIPQVLLQMSSNEQRLSFLCLVPSWHTSQVTANEETPNEETQFRLRRWSTTSSSSSTSSSSTESGYGENGFLVLTSTNTPDSSDR
jgi:hypothetical protein